MMVQYDFEINKIISSTSLQTNFNQMVYKLGNDTLVVVKNLMISPYLDPYIYYYYWNTSYKCNSCVCLVTYKFDSSANECLKDYDRNLSNYTITNTTSDNLYSGNANSTLSEP